MDLLEKIKCIEGESMEKCEKFIKNVTLMHTLCVHELKENQIES